MPDTGECFGGYFYLENILLQQVGTGGRQGVLGPRPLGVAEDRGPWELSAKVAIRDLSRISHPRSMWDLKGLGAGVCPSLGLPLTVSPS